MEITLKQYINNPGGKGDSTNSQKELVKQMYNQKFDLLMMREAGKLNYIMYKKNDGYVLAIKVPDETIEKFYYDVVFEFYTTNNKVKESSNLDNYFVRIYSNDPAFMFTYAYVFNKNKIFIKDLESKMSKLALTQPPVQRNPKESIGYVKSIYFAYMYYKLKGFDRKVLWEKALTYSKSNLLDNIMHAEDKLNQRNELAKTARAQKKFKSKKEKDIAELDDTKPNMVSKIKSVIKTKTVGSTGKVKTVKKVKRK